jgi:hypothetical protein
MMSVRKPIVVYATAILLSYVIACFSRGLHRSSPAPVALSQIRPVSGTIYSLSGDARREDPADILRDSRPVGDSIVFARCAPAAAGNLIPAKLERMCSVLRAIDPRLYSFAFASDTYRSRGIPSEPDQR